MTEDLYPGDPGYDDDKFFTKVINIGIQAARRVGLGLGLFNALRQRFQGAPRWLIGQATTLIGQGVRAAEDWMMGGPDYVIDVTNVPVGPPSFFGPEEQNRLVGIADVPGIDTQTGLPVSHTTRFNMPEDWSSGMIEELAQEEEQKKKDVSPRQAWRDTLEANLHMLFIAKRY